MGFSIANDMSFFSEDTVAQLQKYNPTNATEVIAEDELVFLY